MSFKKTIIPLFICGIVLCLCSCAKEDEFEMPTLVLSESSVLRGIKRNVHNTRMP